MSYGKQCGHKNFVSRRCGCQPERRFFFCQAEEFGVNLRFRNHRFGRKTRLDPENFRTFPKIELGYDRLTD